MLAMGGGKGQGSLGFVYESPNDDYDWAGVAEVQPVEAIAVAVAGLGESGENKQVPTVKLIASLTRRKTCARRPRMVGHPERDRSV